MDFHEMKRKDLQALCKKHNLHAGGTNLELADKLTSLLKKPQVVDPKPQKGLKGHGNNKSRRDEIDRPSKKVKIDVEEEEEETSISTSTRQTRSRRGVSQDTLVVTEEPKNASRRSKREPLVMETVVVTESEVQVVEEKGSRRSKRNVGMIEEESVQLDGELGTSEIPVRGTRSRRGAEEVILPASSVEKKKLRKGVERESDGGGDKKGAKEIVVAPSPVEKRITTRRAKEETSDGDKKASKVVNLSDDGGGKKEVQTSSRVGAEPTVVATPPLEKRKTRGAAKEAIDDGVEKATEVRIVSDDAGSKKEVRTRSRMGADAIVVAPSPVEKRKTRRGAKEETDGDKKVTEARNVSEDAGNKKDVQTRSRIGVEAIVDAPSPVEKRKTRRGAKEEIDDGGSRSTATKENSTQKRSLRNREVLTSEVEMNLKTKDISPRKTRKERENQKNEKEVGDVLNKSTRQIQSRNKANEQEDGNGTLTLGVNTADVESAKVESKVALKPIEKAPSQSKRKASTIENEALKEKVASPENKIKIVDEQSKSVLKPEKASRRSTRSAPTDEGSAQSDRRARTNAGIGKNSSVEAEDVPSPEKQVTKRSRRTTSIINESVKSDSIGNQSPGQGTSKVDQSPMTSQTRASRSKSVGLTNVVLEQPSRKYKQNLNEGGEGVASTNVELKNLEDSRKAKPQKQQDSGFAKSKVSVSSTYTNDERPRRSARSAPRSESIALDSGMAGSAESILPNLVVTAVLPEDGSADQNNKTVTIGGSDKRKPLTKKSSGKGRLGKSANKQRKTMDTQEEVEDVNVELVANVMDNSVSEEQVLVPSQNASPHAGFTAQEVQGTVRDPLVTEKENLRIGNDMSDGLKDGVGSRHVEDMETLSNASALKTATDSSPCTTGIVSAASEIEPTNNEGDRIGVQKVQADLINDVDTTAFNLAEVISHSVMDVETHDEEALQVTDETPMMSVGGTDLDSNLKGADEHVQLVENPCDKSDVLPKDRISALNDETLYQEGLVIGTVSSPVTEGNVEDEENVTTFEKPRELIETLDMSDGCKDGGIVLEEDGKGRTSPISKAYSPSTVNVDENEIELEGIREVDTQINVEEEDNLPSNVKEEANFLLVSEEKKDVEGQEAEDGKGRTSSISQAYGPSNVDNDNVKEIEDNLEVDTPSKVEEEEKLHLVFEEKEGVEGQEPEDGKGRTSPISQAYSLGAVDNSVTEVEDNREVDTPSNVEEETLQLVSEEKEGGEGQDADDRNRGTSPISQGSYQDFHGEGQDAEDRNGGTSPFSQVYDPSAVDIEKNVTQIEDNCGVDTPSNLEEEEKLYQVSEKEVVEGQDADDRNRETSSISQVHCPSIVEVEKNVAEVEDNCEVDPPTNIDEEEKLAGVSEKNDGGEEQHAHLLQQVPDDLLNLKNDPASETDGGVNAVSDELITTDEVSEETSDCKVDKDWDEDNARVSPFSQACSPCNVEDDVAVGRSDAAIYVEIDANKFEDEFERNVDILVKGEDANTSKQVLEGFSELRKGGFQEMVDLSHVESDQHLLRSGEILEREKVNFDLLDGTIATEDNKSLRSSPLRKTSSPTNVEVVAAKEEDLGFEMNDDLVHEEEDVESSQRGPNEFVELEIAEVQQMHGFLEVGSDEYRFKADKQSEGEAVNSDCRDDKTVDENDSIARILPTSQDFSLTDVEYLATVENTGGLNNGTDFVAVGEDVSSGEVSKDFAKNFGHDHFSTVSIENIFKVEELVEGKAMSSDCKGGNDMPEKAEDTGSLPFSTSYNRLNNEEDEKNVATSGKDSDFQIFNISVEDRIYVESSEHVPEKPALKDSVKGIPVWVNTVSDKPIISDELSKEMPSTTVIFDCLRGRNIGTDELGESSPQDASLQFGHTEEDESDERALDSTKKTTQVEYYEEVSEVALDRSTFQGFLPDSGTHKEEIITNTDGRVGKDGVDQTQDFKVDPLGLNSYHEHAGGSEHTEEFVFEEEHIDNRIHREITIGTDGPVAKSDDHEDLGSEVDPLGMTSDKQDSVDESVEVGQAIWSEYHQDYLGEERKYGSDFNELDEEFFPTQEINQIDTGIHREITIDSDEVEDHKGMDSKEGLHGVTSDPVNEENVVVGEKPVYTEYPEDFLMDNELVGEFPILTQTHEADEGRDTGKEM